MNSRQLICSFDQGSNNADTFENPRSSVNIGSRFPKTQTQQTGAQPKETRCQECYCDIYFCENGEDPCSNDRDGDGWADCEDDCIDEPGNADSGCPIHPCDIDSDDDGVPDCDDKCVDVPGNGDDGCAEKKEEDFNKEDPCANRDLRNKVLPTDIVNKVEQRKQTVGTVRGNRGVEVEVNSFEFQNIQNGLGNINLDKYSLNITKLPNGYSPQQLFQEIRNNFTDLVTGGDIPFVTEVELMPYSNEDGNTWNSSNPIGAAMDFDTDLDTSTVVCTEYSLEQMFWTFTTVRSHDHLGHFVAGHRQFGLEPDGQGGFRFFLRGADRLGQWIDFAANGGNTRADLLFRHAGDKTWKNLMGTLEDYINNIPGAEVTPFDRNKEYGKRHTYNENDCK